MPGAAGPPGPRRLTPGRTRPATLGFVVPGAATSLDPVSEPGSALSRPNERGRREAPGAQPHGPGEVSKTSAGDGPGRGWRQAEAHKAGGGGGGEARLGGRRGWGGRRALCRGWGGRGCGSQLPRRRLDRVDACALPHGRELGSRRRR
jgi:hypothetical protein